MKTLLTKFLMNYSHLWLPPVPGRLIQRLDLGCPGLPGEQLRVQAVVGGVVDTELRECHQVPRG